VVKKFHAHLSSPQNAFIYMQSASVLFNVNSINAKYKLSDGPDKHTDFDKTIKVEKLNNLPTDFCVEDTKWTISKNDCYTINRVTLKPQFRVWYHFLKNHFIPSTHNSTISKDCLLLLHSIMVGRKISVGNIIFREVYRCAQKNTGTLNFSLLTTVPC